MAYVIDKATPVLTKLAKRAPGLALDAIDHIAVVANKAVRREVAIAGRVDWHQRISKNGKRKIYRKKGIRKAFQRYSHTDNSQLEGLERFVINKLYAHSMKAVIGFMDVRGFSPDKYRAGKVAGNLSYVKGTMMDKIGKKLEGGGPLTGIFAGKKGHYKARPVVQRAARQIFGQAQSIAQKALDKSVKEFNAEVSA